MVTPVPTSFDPASRIGTVIAGKYRLERLLGAGGMGAVFEAVHTGVQRRFAIKVMIADPTRSPDAVRRFQQEAQAAGLIGHPHIVEVFDLGENEDGTLYMVMELLRGETLHAYLRGGSLPQSDAVAITLELLRALDAAHRAGVVHRDIKPHNLFLAHKTGGSDPGAGATLKVLDFGVAKFQEPDQSAITRSGSIVGTPLYMAPEQVLSDRELDGRADVWAAGATLFEMLTGRPVHLAPHAAAAAVRIVTEPAARVRTLRADVDQRLDDIVAKALEIDREDRFPTALAMIDALEAIAPSLPQSERAPVVMPSAPPRLVITPRDPGLALAPTSAAPSPDPAPPVKQSDTQDRRAGASRGLVLFSAVALVAGVAAGILLVPPGEPERKPVTTPTASASPTQSTAELPTGPASAPPVQIASVQTAPVVDSPPPVASSAVPVASAPIPVANTKRLDRPTHKAPPVASASASIAAPTCGPREILTNGHCCPRGLVWNQDRCDRPLATGL